MDKIVLELNPNYKDFKEGLLTNIGYACEKGEEFKQDYKTAYMLYSIAAEHGDSMAINNIGWLYQNGFGLEKDIFKAIEY